MATNITIKSLQDQLNDLKAEIVELSAVLPLLADKAPRPRPSQHGTAVDQGFLTSTIFGACLLGMAATYLLWRLPTASSVRRRLRIL
jgi:hypothetical protein